VTVCDVLAMTANGAISQTPVSTSSLRRNCRTAEKAGGSTRHSSRRDFETTATDGDLVIETNFRL